MNLKRCYLFVLAITIATLPLQAATRYWVGGISGVWSDPNNWRDFPDSLPGAPQDGDTLNFDNADSFFPPFVRTSNDLVNLTVNSLVFGQNDLESEAYRIDGNPLIILDEIRVFAPETTADLFCNLILTNDVQFHAVAPMGLNYPAKLLVKGSIELNGRLVLRTHYAGEIDLTGAIVGAGDIVLPHYTRVEGY